MGEIQQIPDRQSQRRPQSGSLRENRQSHADNSSPSSGHSKKLLVKFTDVKEDVISELKASVASARHVLGSLPELSDILHGLRPNELTIFSGPTGTGKTTILSQISLDYAIQDIPVLWGSFEIRNTRLIQVMLQQLAGAPVNMWSVSKDEKGNETFVQEMEGLEAFKIGSRRLESLPIHFMNFFGSTDLSSVLYTMDLAVKTHGIQLIILDNLQFMLSDQSASSLDKFDLIDRSISALRKFCNHCPVHIFLVIHPKKEIDNSHLGISSISGTAKATQEADNVIILQKIYDERFIEVKKNRFNGTLGCLPIAFNPDTRTVSVVEASESSKSDHQEPAPPQLRANYKHRQVGRS